MSRCFNWKVLAGLGAVGVAMYLVSPSLVVGTLPFLLLAACPLSMLLMGKSMMGGMQQGAAQGQQAAAAGGGDQPYTCPMHAGVRRVQPGRCPECAMDLVPATRPEQAAGQRPVAAEPVAPVSREAQLGLLRAQMQVLQERQAALAAQLAQVQEVEDAATPPSAALVEAERVAQAAAARS